MTWAMCGMVGLLGYMRYLKESETFYLEHFSFFRQKLLKRKEMHNRLQLLLSHSFVRREDEDRVQYNNRHKRSVYCTDNKNKRFSDIVTRRKLILFFMSNPLDYEETWSAATNIIIFLIYIYFSSLLCRLCNHVWDCSSTPHNFINFSYYLHAKNNILGKKCLLRTLHLLLPQLIHPLLHGLESFS